ncbi:MAG: hypothetical protein JXB35_11290, partial [Anaerolineae bacterium]|nr:hypothetical protein [Anaerolineae bacterium]
NVPNKATAAETPDIVRETTALARFETAPTKHPQYTLIGVNMQSIEKAKAGSICFRLFESTPVRI